MNKGKYYMTTAIAYTSGKPHIGNSYEIVLADAIARFKRADGYDVFFQTGTDEHGQKIELKAEEAGVSPKEFVDKVAGQIREICDMLNTSYDKFIRTTDDYHEKQVQKIFRKLYEQGDIYKGAYEGMYCTPCESFWTESQLVDGKCPDCGRECKPAKEEAYFFKMSKYADRLIEHINTHPEFIQPVSRKNEMMNNFLLPGLQDLCVSRTSFKWGIPVDFDDKHVVYVWLDALTNYITGIGYDADGNSTEQYKKLWPADLHLIGKDIIRFHTIYWPIFLMALGEPLPKQVFGHPWLLMGGGKMSKSKGNIVNPTEMIDRYGADTVRLFCLFAAPPERDFDWTESGIEGASRFLQRIWRLFHENRSILKTVRGCSSTAEDCVTPEARDLRGREHATVKKAGEDMGLRNQFNTAISAIMELVNAMYTYRDKMDDSEGERNVFSSAMATVITTLSPITPHICEELWERLGHTSHLAGEPWPTYDEKAMVKDTQTIALQVNGKLRGTMEAPTGADKKPLEDLALATEQIRRFTKDLTIRKVIVVPGKIVNVVAK